MNFLISNFLETIIYQQMPNFGKSFYIVLPEFVLYTCVFTLIIIAAYNNNKISKTNILIIIIKITYYFILFTLFILYIQIISTCYINSSSNSIHALLFKFFFLLLNLFLLSYLPIVLNNKYYVNAIELPILIQISIALIFTLITTQNWVIILLALEGFSLILYILTTIDRSQGGITAAAKYFSFGTLGSVFLLWGVVHIYSIEPVLLINVINDLVITTQTYGLFTLNNSLEFANSLIILGLLIKLGAAPFQQWVADVYAGSHLLITLYFSTVVKFIIFLLLTRVAITNTNSDLIDFCAILSLLIGTIMTLRQLEIKRFLAYSSITHVGYILMGDFMSALLYIIIYIFASLLFFSILLIIQINQKELIYFSDISKLKNNNGYWLPLLLTIALLSMAGLPPLSGFFAKFMIWSSLIEDLYIYNDITSYILLISSIIFSLITIFYYIRILIYIFIANEYLYIHDLNVNIQNNITINTQQSILAIVNVFWIFFHTNAISLILL